MPRPSSPLISHDAVVEASLRIIDRGGLDAFSLPRLARELGVQTPSLYYHFRDRADILRTVARAIVLEPTFVVLDEPTSALDMLIQAQIVDLLRDLQKRRELTYVFISHDLKVVGALACRVMVMRNGKVVEEGPAGEVFANPKDPYTRALFAAAFKLETAPEGVVAQ